MAEYEIFQNPPITEAMIDIRSILPDEVTLEDLDLLHEKIKDRFPNKTVQNFFKGRLEISQEEGKEKNFFDSETGIRGYMFHAADDSAVVQFRIDGFTYNNLKTYQNWIVFSEQGKHLWDLYSETAKPNKINRIGLRYINRIEIPLPFSDFTDYILTIPSISKDLPQNVSTFFMRLEMPDPKNECNAVIIQTVEPPPYKDNKLPFIFDIEVFKEGEYADSQDKIWKDLRMLKKFGNDIFFKSITDKTGGLFK